jgi:ribosomal protein S18 acetylase RimI-like enzyme
MEKYMPGLAILCVAKSHRNHGVGKKLLDKSVRKIKNICLCVRQKNQFAIKMYTKAGFVVKSEIKNYYANPADDAFYMEKNE